MQYYDVISNPRWLTTADMKIVVVLAYLSEKECLIAEFLDKFKPIPHTPDG